LKLNPCETTNALIVSIQNGELALLTLISAWLCHLDGWRWWTWLGSGSFLSEL